MLSCDNICHGGEGLGVGLEEVGEEGLADAEQQLGVDGRLVVNALQGTRTDTDTVGEPLVGVTLSTEFVADKVAYVYLHIAICCYADGDVRSPRPATDSLSKFRRPQTKRKASNLVSQSAVVEYLSKERPKYSPIGEHLPLSSFEPLMKVPRFRLGRNK